MAEQGVVLHVQLGVQGHHPVVPGYDQGVDFHQGTVVFGKDAVQGIQRLGRRSRLGRLQSQPGSQPAGLVGHQPQHRLNRLGVDVLGVGGGHLLNVHSPGGADNHHRPPETPVNGQGHVELPSDVGQFLDQHRVYWNPLGVGLVGYQVLPQEGLGGLLRLFRRAHHLDAAGLAPTAGVDLGFDYRLPAQLLGGLAGFLGRVSQYAPGHRDAVASENLFGLILVQLHLCSLVRVIHPGGDSGWNNRG